jgi:hypothetical protein
MEKFELKTEPKKSFRFNGYILSIQYQGMPPTYTYVPVDSKLESIVSSALKSHPHAIILIQASTDL